MNFSADWDERYRENTHLSVWPWSDLVSLVKRHCQLAAGARVLELGCGAGANIPFFQSLGVAYYGLDGSATIVARLRQRFPDLASQIEVADFSVNQVFRPGFDLVVDRAAITHNSTAAIEATLRVAWEMLKPGGTFVGIDWFSTESEEFNGGSPDVDAFTRCDYQIGPFAGTGRVHFADERHLRSLFHRFDWEFLEHKVVRRVHPEDSGRFASWNLVVRRPVV